MKFRKKPVVIEAEQFLYGGEDCRGICRRPCLEITEIDERGRPTAHVHTVHNNQAVPIEYGDWIIPENDDVHFYPCKPEIFERTYEPVLEEAQ